MKATDTTMIKCASHQCTIGVFMIRRMNDILRLVIPIIMLFQAASMPQSNALYSARDMYFALSFGLAIGWYADIIGHSVVFVTDKIFSWITSLRG